MKLFRSLAVSSAALAFAIAVLGSWVRINGAGLTCPDWPLCRGALVPSLAGGVILEWSHRAIASALGFVVLGTIVAGVRVRARVAGVTPVLAALGFIFVAQVTLGGATVLLANSPLSVMLHWGMAMALLATLCALAVLALREAAPPSGTFAWSALRDGPAPVLALAALFAFATMCLGAYVSSSHAGLACRTLPACDGTLWGTGPAQFAQMAHRIAAGSFTVVAALAARIAWQTGSAAVRAYTVTGCALLLAQIALGAGNVLGRLPFALREAHAANAAATFVAFVIAAVVAACEPARVATRESAGRARRIAPSA